MIIELFISLQLVQPFSPCIGAIQTPQRVEATCLTLETLNEALLEVAETTPQPLFDPHDLNKPSLLPAEVFHQLLKNTGVHDVASVFSQAEQTYGVNALFLAGLTALESGWGNSRRAVEDNNLTGYNITSPDVSYHFSSRAESILATAELIATDYLDESGRYHHGTSVWSVNEKYCAESDWSTKIISIVHRLKNDIKG